MSSSSCATPDTVRIALVQMSCVDTKEANVAKALARIREAAAQGAHLVCLQELFATHYPCQDEDHARFALAEPIPGPTHDRLQEAADREQVVVISSLFERRAPGLYHNTTVVFDADGRSLGRYRKMHIPDDPQYYEKFYFTPGDLGFQCFSTRCGCVGVGICWDQWFPEAARLMALQGAEMLFYPTAIGWLSTEKQQYGESQRSAWETAMRAHAIANGVYVAAVNRVGTERQIEFWGSSFASDPYGNVLHRAATQQEELVLVDYHRSLIDTVRTHWPFLRDRRIDAYGDLTRRFLD
ncbi:MAG: carbon-nitrogen hydrolase [Pirellulaceae bacterium]